MPIYEYTCQKCNKPFESLVLGGDTPVCPACGSASVKRRMSTCGFVSRGGNGQPVTRSAGSSSCAGCTSSNCSSCGS